MIDIFVQLCYIHEESKPNCCTTFTFYCYIHKESKSNCCTKFPFNCYIHKESNPNYCTTLTFYLQHVSTRFIGHLQGAICSYVSTYNYLMWLRTLCSNFALIIFDNVTESVIKWLYYSLPCNQGIHRLIHNLSVPSATL
jgi:hypothetical protein